MCVLAGRARVPQIYIKVLLPVLPLESSRIFFPLPDLKNTQVQELFKSGGRGSWLVADFILFWWRGEHDGCCFNNIIKTFKHTEGEQILQKTPMYPLPRSYSYCFIILFISHIYPAIYTSIGQFRVGFFFFFPRKCLSDVIKYIQSVMAIDLNAFQSKFQTSVHFPLNTSASTSLNRTQYCLWLLLEF